MITRRTRLPRWARRAAGLAVALALGIFVAWVWFGSLPAQVLVPASAAEPVLVDRVGRALGPARSTFGEGGAGSTSLAERADRLVLATLAAEDQRFFGHAGVDPIAVGRVALSGLWNRSFDQGGSTITQQLVKLRLGGGSRTVVTKAKEMVYALRLERRMSKEAILSAYLAEAPYGGRIVGAEAAARLYFDTPASQLSWAQAAFLAALPQRPTAYNPLIDPLAARARQRWILGRLRRGGVITVDEEKIARRAPLSVSVARPDDVHGIAPHFTEMVAALLRDDDAGKSATVASQPSSATRTGVVRAGSAPEVASAVAAGTANSANSAVRRTTLDAVLQHDVAGIARHHRELLRKKGAANVAVVVLEHATGAVRAWEGSGQYLDWDHGGMINGPLIPRQTGSTIKPFVYALAFENGAAPGDMIDDEPVVYEWAGQSFKPENYDRRYRGAISMRTALASSINVPAVKLVREHGPAALGGLLDRFELRPPAPASTYGLSLALGAPEIGLLPLTRAFAAFANRGVLPPVRYLESGPPVFEGATAPAVSAATAFLITDVLRDNDARAPVFGRRSALSFDFPVAAKTGTSQDFHDNWVVGSTDRFTVGVWVGNFDRVPLREGASGVTGAGPIFHAVMLAAHERLGSGVADSEPPLDLRRVAVCERANCAAPRWDYDWSSVAKNNSPTSTDGATGRSKIVVPTTRVSVAALGTPNRVDRVPAETRADAGASSAASVPTARDRPIVIVQPAQGSHYVIDPTVPVEFQLLPLKAAGGTGPYRFTVDGQNVVADVVEGRAGSVSLWRLVRGRHEVCAIDSSAARRCTWFRVT